MWDVLLVGWLLYMYVAFTFLSGLNLIDASQLEWNNRGNRLFLALLESQKAVFGNGLIKEMD